MKKSGQSINYINDPSTNPLDKKKENINKLLKI